MFRCTRSRSALSRSCLRPATPGYGRLTPVPLGLFTTESIKLVSLPAVDAEVAVEPRLGVVGLDGLALRAGHVVEQMRGHYHAPVCDAGRVQGESER